MRGAGANELQLALSWYTSPHKIDNGQENDRPEKRNEQARRAEVALIDGRHPEERAQEPSAKGRANDPDHDVEQNALSRSHDRARCPSDQSTDDQPDDDVHKCASDYLSLID